MQPAAAGNSGGNGGDDEEPEECEPEKPMEVVFTAQTFRKLIAWTFGPLLIVLVGGLSAFFYFYHKTNSHLDDPVIHLTRGERTKLETKVEAHKERTKLKKEITGHFDVKVREIRVEQKEQVIQLGNELKAAQRARLNKILIEVKKARKDIKNQ
jgi:hypothetical protein